jgi:ATP-dependent protease HslVU (ClpYQ) peptidase subunit
VIYFTPKERRWPITTVVGIEGIDYAVLVADSQITESNLVTLALSTPKIVEIGKFLLAISGDTRPGDILAYNWKPPAYRGENPVSFMGKKVIPSIIKAFNENNYDFNKVDPDGGFDYLLSFNGNIFRVACDLSFFQSDVGAYAIGSGGQFALGYLYSDIQADLELEDAKRLARKAVEIASVLDVNTGKPLQLVVQERTNLMTDAKELLISVLRAKDASRSRSIQTQVRTIRAWWLPSQGLVSVKCTTGN